MALDPTEVVVAGTGHIFRGPVGTPMPDDIDDALDAAFVDLGYTTPAGVAFEFGRDTKDLFAWQVRDAIRTLLLNQPKTVTFTQMQWNNDTFDLAVGGGEWGTTANGVEFTPADGSFVNEVALIVEFEDDDKHYRFCFPRALNKNPFSFSTLPDDSANLPIAMSLLAPEDDETSYKVQTDDPAFAATGS